VEQFHTRQLTNVMSIKKTTGQIGIAIIVVGLLTASIYFVGGNDIQAQDAPINAFAWYTPSNVSGMHSDEFNNLSTIPGVNVTVQNMNDFSQGTWEATGQAMVNQMTAVAQQDPNAMQVMGFMSHGDPGSYYTATGYSMPTEVGMVTAAYQNANVQGITIVDCCGSGNLASYVQQNGYDIFGDATNNLGAITSSSPGESSWVGNNASTAGRLAVFTNDINAADANQDGVITMAELKEGFAQKGFDNQFIIPPGNEGAPVFAKDKATMDEYMKKWIGMCAVVKPGQDEKFDGVWGMKNVYKYDDKSTEKKDINGDKATKRESELNYKLRMADFGCLNWSMEKGKTTDARQKPGCNPTDKSTSNYDILEKDATKSGGKSPDWASGGKYTSLSEDQAKQSLGDNLHAYTVPDGKTMKPTFYTKGTRTYDSKEKVVFVKRENCKFVDPPSPLPFTSPKPSANDNPFNNNKSGGNQGGQPNQGGQQGNSNQTSPTPTPGSSSGQNTAVVCPQTYAPVCDVNGQTQPNDCVATQQKKVTIKHTGACTEEEKKQATLSIADLSVLIKQVITSGIPQNTVTTIVESIIKLFSSYVTTSNSV